MIIEIFLGLIVMIFSLYGYGWYKEIQQDATKCIKGGK